MTDDAAELVRLASKIVARAPLLDRHWFFWNRICVGFAYRGVVQEMSTRSRRA